jgi:hypothetical protein
VKRFRAVFFWCAMIMAASITQAQDLNVLKSGVVRVDNTKTGDVGAGFILKIEKDRLYVITASHIVRKNEHPNLYLYDRQNDPLPATVIHREFDEDKGLALLMLKAKEELFARVTAVSLDHTVELKGGEPIEVIGFPDGSRFWSVASGSVLRIEGRSLVFAAPVRSGNSGGPVFFKGRVIGLVSDVLPESEYAVPVASILQYVGGIDAKLAQSITFKVEASKDNQSVTTTDKSKFCQVLSEVVDASKDGFYRIMKDAFNTSIVLPGFRYGSGRPTLKYVSFTNFIGDESKATGQYYDLIAKAKQCLADWKQIDSQLRSESLKRDDRSYQFRKADGTTVIISMKATTSSNMVDISIHARDSHRVLFDGQPAVTALSFLETAADRERFCQAAKQLVDASSSGFIDIVGTPSTTTGRFESKIKIAGFPDLTIVPRSEAYLIVQSKDANEIQALGYALISTLAKCFPEWNQKESSGLNRQFYEYRFTQGENGASVEVSYHQFGDVYLFLKVQPPGSIPR